MISRFLWNGEKVRIKFTTLQLLKQKGGIVELVGADRILKDMEKWVIYESDEQLTSSLTRIGNVAHHIRKYKSMFHSEGLGVTSK